jgi:Fic family protein
LVNSIQKKWVWQHSAWPRFTWDTEALIGAIGRVRQAQGEMGATAKLLDPQLGLTAQQETLTTEALMTSAIEGEKLDPAGLRSSIARRLGLPTAGLPTPSRGVEGLVEMLIDATQRYEQPLTLKRLHGWQAALFPTGRSGLHEIKVGTLRGAQPMRIVSGPVDRERVHYEAPPHERLASEMRSFVEWFNRPPANLDGLLRAGLAHAWFELIHPYEDGNGRVGRALLDMALAQDERRSIRFYSMSARLMMKRDDYYSALERASTGSLDLTEWLSWFLEQVEAAMASSEWLVNAVLRKAQFWVAYAREEFNERQLKALNRMLDAGPEGFVGGMTNKKYQHLTGSSAATGQRDLADLVKKGCLIHTGSGRSVRYELAPANSGHQKTST